MRGLDREATDTQIDKDGGLSHAYAFLVVTSRGVATLGRMLNPAAAIIGAMRVGRLSRARSCRRASPLPQPKPGKTCGKTLNTARKLWKSAGTLLIFFRHGGTSMPSVSSNAGTSVPHEIV